MSTQFTGAEPSESSVNPSALVAPTPDEGFTELRAAIPAADDWAGQLRQFAQETRVLACQQSEAYQRSKGYPEQSPSVKHLREFVVESWKIARRFREYVEIRPPDEPDISTLIQFKNEVDKLADWFDEAATTLVTRPGLAIADSVPMRAERGEGEVSPVTSSPTGGTGENEGGTPSTWKELGEAKQAIIQVLAAAVDAMQNAAVARKAGYKPGTLRHHYRQLQMFGLIELTKDGYKITSTGRAILPASP